jgi:beta-lactamase class D
MTRRGIVGVVAATACLFHAVPMRAVSASCGRPTQQPLTHSCVAFWDSANDLIWQSDRRACNTRLSPASTFKIPHALVALSTGAVTKDSVERWDGTRFPGAPAWEQDHTILSALKPSVVWFFQRIAPRIGARRMAEWLERMDYGNARTGGDVTTYWLNGTLQISAMEQVSFLRRFYSERLELDRGAQRLVREALDQAPGSIESSRGVSRLEGSWARDIRWNAKTGRTEYAGREVGWLIGELSTNGRSHIFATAVWRDGGSVGFLDAANLSARTFQAHGLLQGGRRK